MRYHCPLQPGIWCLSLNHTPPYAKEISLSYYTFYVTYFPFNDKYYLQIFSTPMASPISPILAMIIMDSLLGDVIPRLPFQIPFLYKYVDDIISSVPRDMIDTTLVTFNSYNNNLQCTIEAEDNCSVQFLNTKVIHTTDNRILLDWYQKPTSSGRFLNFHSNHALNQKYNAVIAMKNRVTHISDLTFINFNMKRLFGLFANNDYPQHVLNKLIYSSNLFDGAIDDRADNPFKYKFPYIDSLTHFRAFNNIQIATYNMWTIGNLFTKTKDKTLLLNQSSVVYNISCQDCYIGQTSQKLKNIITQHKNDSRIGKRSCALAVCTKS